MARFTVLFVRCLEDLPASVEAVNALLAIRRVRDLSGSTDEVVGIWVHPALDRKLATWPTVAADEPNLWLRESSGVSHVWTYAWIDGPILRHAAGAEERRAAVGRALTTGPSTDSFLPSYGSAADHGLFLAWPRRPESDA